MQNPSPEPSPHKHDRSGEKSTPQGAPATAARTTRARRHAVIAAVAGLLGFLCFLVTPFLPVQQTESALNWPQDGEVNSVIAPQMSYTPQSIDIAMPCELVSDLPDEGGILVSTAPGQGENTSLRALFVRATEDNVEITSRGRIIANAERNRVEAGDCSEITVAVRADTITGEFVGMTDAPNASRTVDDAFGLRPTLVGIYTDLPTSTSPEGMSVHVDVDSRFTSNPSVIKWTVMAVGVLATLIALWALHQLDKLDGRSSRRFLPSRLFRFRLVDGVVAGVLVVWHFIGANTSDDGYILSMARVASDADYMANYYRWYGVPESPFGSPYYDMLALISHVSTNSLWMRLPALIAGILCWLLLSKEVIPRLGRAARTTPVVHWTAAAVFLAFWTAFNNGLRPEPIIAFGALLTWCSIERAVATRRLLPAAIACIIAAFSLAAGPTGLMAVAALLAGTRPVIAAIVVRARILGGGIVRGVLPLVLPILAAGTMVLVAVFGDQTAASVREAIRVRGEIGPNLHWYQEFIRYYYLLIQTVDGSLARRLPMLLTLLCLAVVIGLVLSRGRIPGAAKGPTTRFVIVVVGTMFFIMFSPTKWTHHFGVYASIGAAIAALASLAIYRVALNSSRNRTLFLAVSLLVLAVAAAGTNGWWYVSSFGIPWWDRPPSFRGIQASTVLLVMSVALFALAAFQHLRADYTRQTTPQTSAGRNRLRSFAAAPVAVIAGLLVVFNVASLAKGAQAQYPGYSVGLGNAKSLAGEPCMLAEQVLVEPDANAGMLAPVDPNMSASEALEGRTSTGFDPDGVASDLSADSITGSVGTAGSTEDPDSGPEEHKGQGAGTSGGEGSEGINGSTVALPFGLDPAATPVLGSYRSGPQQEANLETGWYSIPEDDDSPLLVVTAAGRVAHLDVVGSFAYGQDLVFQFGQTQPDGSVTPVGEDVLPKDIGPNPSWRNLRVPRSEFPEGADSVRISIRDGDLNPDQWVAITPPRMAQLDTLQDYVGSEDPVLLDWAVGLQFPCQRPFGHSAGVAEVPKFRILPDRPLAVTATGTWQDYKAGGPLGWATMGLEAESVPTYLNHSWDRDWGSLERYTPYGTYAGQPVPAEVDTTTRQRWGWWEPEAKIFVTNPQ